MLRVKLDDILDALEFESDETHYYLDRQTGNVFLISDEAFAAAEDDDVAGYLPDWQKEEVPLAREVLDDTDSACFIELPDRFDLDEYRLMEKFAYGVDDEAASNRLARAIRGRGAFRYFKDLVHELGLADRWYKYRDEAIREVAIEWCEANQIEYTDD